MHYLICIRLIRLKEIDKIGNFIDKIIDKIRNFLTKIYSYLEKYKFSKRFEGLRLNQIS